MLERENSGLALRSTSEGKGFPSVKVFESFYHSIDLSDKKACINSLDTFYSDLDLLPADDESNLPAAAKHHIRTLALLLTGDIGKKKSGGNGGKGDGRSRLQDLPFHIIPSRERHGDTVRLEKANEKKRMNWVYTLRS